MLVLTRLFAPIFPNVYVNRSRREGWNQEVPAVRQLKQIPDANHSWFRHSHWRADHSSRPGPTRNQPQEDGTRRLLISPRCSRRP
jgi:hypothetical protein